MEYVPGKDGYSGRLVKTAFVFLISNFCRVLNGVCFLLGNSPAPEVLYADVSEHSVPSSWASMYEE